MKRRAVVMALAVAGAAASGAVAGARVGQSSATTAQASHGLILGRVVDGDSGAGVSGAVVTLAIGAGAVPGAPLPAGPGMPARGARPGASPAPQQVMADGEGRFVFHDLPAGSLRLTAKAPGYLDGELGEMRPGRTPPSRALAPDERLTDATIRVWKYAVLGGMVTDDAGEPAVQATVTVYHRTATGGRVRYVEAASVRTDDRGVYRAASLEPGEYLVAAPQTAVTMPRAVVEGFMQGMLSGSGSRAMLDTLTSGGPPPVPGGVQVGDLLLQQATGSSAAPSPPPSADGGLFAYQTVFYPAAPSAAEASPIALQSGQERSDVNLQLRLVPTARVMGQVLGPAGPTANLAVHLRSASDGDAPAGIDVDTATTLSTADGTFTFLAVPAGQYVATVVKTPPPPLPPELASSPLMKMAFGNDLDQSNGTPSVLWAEVPVTVAGADVAGVALTLRDGATVSGRVAFDGAGAAPAPAELKAMRVTMAPLSGSQPPMLAARADMADEAGVFKTTGRPPGRYAFSVIGPRGWRTASISIGGQELIGPLTLAGQDVTNVVVTMTNQLGRIEGTVRASGAATLPPVTVVVFSADRQWWDTGTETGRGPHTVSASKEGQFSVASVLSGDYYLAALPDAQVPDALTTAFLESVVPVATRVTVANGEQRSLDLRLGAIK